MAFLELEDINGRYEATVFPQVYKMSDITIGALYKFRLKFENGIICEELVQYKKEGE